MKIENINIYNIYLAILGARYSYNSTDKSDSLQVNWVYLGDNKVLYNNKIEQDKNIFFKEISWESFNHAVIGENDLKLLSKLCKAGSSHRKFLRQILVSMDIIAPRYFWSEYDTYKVGTVANSESTIHTITKRKLTLNDFEEDIYIDTLNHLNDTIEKYNLADSNDLKMEYFRSIKNNLPEGFLQKRHVTLNYEVLCNMYNQRKNHRLNEWHYFCEIVSSLPYAKEFIIGE